MTVLVTLTVIQSSTMNPHIGKKLLERMGWSSGQGLGKNNDGSVLPLACELVEKQDRRGLESSLERAAPAALPIVVLPDGLPPPRPAPPVVADPLRRVCPTIRSGAIAGVTAFDYSNAAANEVCNRKETASGSATAAQAAAMDFTSDDVASVSMLAPAGTSFLTSKPQTVAAASSIATNFQTFNKPEPSASGFGGGVSVTSGAATGGSAAATVASGAGASSIIKKHPVSLLYELAAKNYWAPPDLECEEQVIGYDLSGSMARKQFRVLVRLNGRTHTGSWELQKKKARTTSAITALTELGLVPPGAIFALASAAEDFS